jgi:hypothetical protein
LLLNARGRVSEPYGEWAGASCVLRAQETFTVQSGGSGEYVGEICT